MPILRSSLACAVVVSLAASTVIRGQQQRVRPRLQSVEASAGASLTGWITRVDDMLHDGGLQIARTQADTMVPGRTHQRLAQFLDGLPVFGGELIRQLRDRQVLSVFGSLFENVAVGSLQPQIDDAAAAAAAERAAGAGAVAGTPVLGILPQADGSVLVYRLVVRSAWNIETIFVNATTGAIERRETRIRRQQPTDVPKIGAGTGVLSDKKKMSADLFGGTYYAFDIMRPADAVTLDFHGSANRFNTFLQFGTVSISDIASSSNNTWTDGAIVDAHVYQGWVYDFYYKSFGRRGLDDNNIPIVGIVHPLARADASRYAGDVVGQFINNAAYIGDGFMYYGDGDGQLFDYLAGSLDVIAHELTHGVTDFSSQLEYHDEPGALNEAFSDIMGTSAEYFLEKTGQGPQKGPNFIMGEDVTKASPGFVRSLQNPIAGGDPDHYSLRQYIGTPIDDGGVHVNSTIVSHAFYLAVAGGRNRVSGIQVSGIGVGNIDRMARIFYRGFVFMLGPRAQFADARVATLQAATDLYGANSNERAQLAQAWTAVGVQ